MTNISVDHSELSIKQYFHILRARKWLLVGTVGMAAVLSVLYTLQLPETYTAKTTLNFELQGGNPFFNDSSVRGGEYLTTQIGILKSQAVADRVIESLTDDEASRLEQAYKDRKSLIKKANIKLQEWIYGLVNSGEGTLAGDTEKSGGAGSADEARYERPEWLAPRIRGDLKVEPQYSSRIVVVSFVSTNPKVASTLANAYADAYIRLNLEMMTDPAKRSRVWFDRQVDELKSNFETAQQRLTEFQQRTGITASDERVDTENRHLDELSSQLITAEAEVRQIETQLSQLESAIAKGDSVLSLPIVVADGIVQRTQAEIRQLEAKLAEQSSKLGANHPQYLRTKSEISSAKDRLEDSVNAVIAGVKSALILAREKYKALEKAFAAQKQQVLDLKEQRDKMLVLRREVESAQSIYNTALTQFNQTNLRSVMDQTNVNVVDPAVTPGGPSGPRMSKNVAIGVLIGGILALGLIVLLEVVDRRIRSREDVQLDLQLPLLGVLDGA
jgi:uncharacterized protein involved in exopolysaccharide biosynthesis